MIRVYRISFVAITTVLLAGSTMAQDAPKPGHADPSKPDLEVFPLKYVMANEAAQMVSNMIGVKPGPSGVRVIAVQSGNALLVQAPAASMDQVRNILAKVDVPPPSNNEKLTVFQLRTIEPNQPFQDALKLVLRGRGFALDPQRKTVIVNADREISQEVQSLIMRLEEQAIRPTVANVQVRVVWLLNGDEKVGSALAADLKEILPDLAKVGIDKPRLAAQTLVNVTPGMQFTAEGRATIRGDSRFSVSGRFTDKKDGPSLHLSVRATNRGAGPGEPQDFGRVDTDIIAPLGHLVVFGVTPTDDLTSVFVVQVLRPAASGK